MKNAIRWWALILVVGGIVAAFYYYWRQSAQAPPPPPRAEAPAPEPPPEPRIRHPIEAAQPVKEAAPLPPLNTSDGAALDVLRDLFDEQTVKYFFYPENIIRRFVVTIDNLPRKQVPARYRPITRTAGKFPTTGEEESLVLNPDNYRRYTPYVRLAAAVDTKKLVAAYIRFYSLFQQAYEELGYPEAYFNDRLIEVIDDLLAAPDVAGPIKLVQPKVMYQFADPALEARSAGQKILIRMGNENAASIKAKLREIRQELAG